MKRSFNRTLLSLFFKQPHTTRVTSHCKQRWISNNIIHHIDLISFHFSSFMTFFIFLLLLLSSMFFRFLFSSLLLPHFSSLSPHSPTSILCMKDLFKQQKTECDKRIGFSFSLPPPSSSSSFYRRPVLLVFLNNKKLEF